jgi:hypothetical protein
MCGGASDCRLRDHGVPAALGHDLDLAVRRLQRQQTRVRYSQVGHQKDRSCDLKQVQPGLRLPRAAMPVSVDQQCHRTPARTCTGTALAVPGAGRSWIGIPATLQVSRGSSNPATPGKPAIKTRGHTPFAGFAGFKTAFPRCPYIELEARPPPYLPTTRPPSQPVANHGRQPMTRRPASNHDSKEISPEWPPDASPSPLTSSVTSFK